MGKCGAPGRRARFEGISGLAALALEMPQDSINHACISNNGDNLHLSATGTQHGIYFKNLGKQARPCAASIFGELRVLVSPGGLCQYEPARTNVEHASRAAALQSTPSAGERVA